MATTRRRFLATAAAGLARPAPAALDLAAELDRILAGPALETDFLDKPVTVASIELLRNGKTYLLRTRSADGAEAVTVPNPDKMAAVYPFVLKSVLPVFLRKDARDLERLQWD